MNKKAGYRDPVEKDDDVFTVEDFREMCKRGSFIDYDGFGYPVKDGLGNPDVWVKPSRLHEIPADATHVNWFNR